MAKGVLTTIGREMLCKAHAGDIVLPKIMKMGFGKGGVDENGQVIAPSGGETTLRQELLQKVIDSHSFPINTTANYVVTLGAEELAGENISEQGLFDSEGNLVAYKTFLPKGKDGDIEFQFDMQEIF